ncbi:hypothetical protein [Streptomyces sp. WAC 06783]|uniref:hypothetical protein n=1 Tax=Streptomyces sp. WAC 06783 TaxID=2203211 RepID=UPI00163D1AB5|nr:hypothetical protein [Streptomyces sp. WAC 06783]
MTLEAAADALPGCADQLTAMLPKPVDRDGRLRGSGSVTTVAVPRASAISAGPY